MAIRIFKCGICGHRMRVGQARCGYCHSKRPLHRTLWPYGTMAALAAVIALSNQLPAPAAAAASQDAASVYAAADQ